MRPGDISVLINLFITNARAGDPPHSVGPLPLREPKSPGNTLPLARSYSSADDRIVRRTKSGIFVLNPQFSVPYGHIPMTNSSFPFISAKVPDGAPAPYA